MEYKSKFKVCVTCNEKKEVAIHFRKIKRSYHDSCLECYLERQRTNAKNFYAKNFYMPELIDKSQGREIDSDFFVLQQSEW